jgi:hypothetical protein
MMQHSNHSFRYSSDSGNNQYSNREISTGTADADQSYRSQDGRKHITKVGNSVYAQPYHHRTSYTSEKSDFTKTSKSTTGTTSHSQRKSIEQQTTTSVTTPTIALFGVGSKTSIYFLRQALDAGYQVRAMIIQQSTAGKDSSGENHSTLYPHDIQVHALAKEIRDEFSAQEASGILHWIRADYIYDTNAIRRTIRNTQFVVCIMQDNAPLSSYGITPADDSTGTSKSVKKRQPSHIPSMILPMDPKLCPDPNKPITSFIQLLYPLMKRETSIKVFLYQVCTWLVKE